MRSRTYIKISYFWLVMIAVFWLLGMGAILNDGFNGNAQHYLTGFEVWMLLFMIGSLVLFILNTALAAVYETGKKHGANTRTD